MVTSVTEGGGIPKFSQKYKTVETYCHDHSLESSDGIVILWQKTELKKMFFDEKNVKFIKLKVEPGAKVRANKY
jgi:hypothetical protein